MLLEIALRLFPADRVVSKALYYQQMDTPVYRPSDDPFLHYELRPNAEYSHPPPQAYRVRINRWGARGREYDETKAPGVFRILAFGGSTMFGYAVNDEQAIAAQLEGVLNNSGDGQRYEVWNFGASAYTAAQAARLASRQISRHGADLILFQLHNRGRRPFLLPSDGSLVDFAPYLADTDTVLENFPTPFLLPPTLHVALMRRSATYRGLAASIRLASRSGSGMDSGSSYGDEISFGEVGKLIDEARARKIAIVFVTLPQARTPPARIAAGARDSDVIHLYQAGREVEFYDEHPPPRILAEWSATIASELRQRCLLGSCPEPAHRSHPSS